MDKQQGFKTGRSWTDGTFVLSKIGKKSLEYNKPVYLDFINIKEASI